MENDIRRNGSGYVDPTAHKAIKNMMREERNRDSMTFLQLSLPFVICRIFTLRNVSL